MQGYTRKIIIISALVYCVMHFGYLPTVFYSMSNTPSQMLFFTIVSLMVLSFFTVLGIVITYVLTRPVQDFLHRLDANESFQDDELFKIFKKNEHMPLTLSLLFGLMFSLMEFALYGIYRLNSAGPIGISSVFITFAVGNLSAPSCLYGALSFVTSPTHSYLHNICQSHNINAQQKGKGLGAHITVPMVLFSIAVSLWMTMPGMYESVMRIRDEAGTYLSYIQKNEMNDLLADKTGPIRLDELKPAADRITSNGLGTAFIADTKGNMLYNPGAAEIFNKRWEDINASIRTAFAGGQSGNLFENVHEQIICYTPLDGDMVLGTVVKLEDKLPHFKKFWVTNVILVIVVIIMCIYLGTALVIGIVKPINKIKEKINDLSYGQGDLTSRLTVPGGDEIGALASGFNGFMAVLQTMIKDISTRTAALTASSTELAEISNQMSDGAENTLEQSNTVVEAAKEMAMNVTSVAEDMDKATTNLTNIATAIEQMTSTISEIAVSSEKARATSEAAVNDAARASEMVITLDDASQEIGKVTETIMQISSQINLLSLNATIEAARAGSGGKGFAVVAGEIKELAQKTAEATVDIKNKIAAIQSTAGSTIDEISSISTVIKDVSNIVTNIAGAIEEQSVTAKDISHNIVLATSGVQGANARVAQSSSGVGTITQEISGVCQSTQEMNNAASQVKTNAGDLSHMAEYLQEMVRRFTV